MATKEDVQKALKQVIKKARSRDELIEKLDNTQTLLIKLAKDKDDKIDKLMESIVLWMQHQKDMETMMDKRGKGEPKQLLAIGGGGKWVDIKEIGGSDLNLGYTTEDKSLPVVQSGAATATLSNVSASASSVTLLSANTDRLGAFFYNDSASAVNIKFGTTASATSFTVRVAANSFYEMPVPVYTGRIDGIWDVATGACRITELS